MGFEVVQVRPDRSSRCSAHALDSGDRLCLHSITMFSARSIGPVWAAGTALYHAQTAVPGM
jgi:hypothetical protein